MKAMFKALGIIAITAMIVFAMTACEGPMGPEGPQGVPGTNGTPGTQGTPGAAGSKIEVKLGIDQDEYPNNTWWIDGVDTHIAVAGKDGDVGTLDSVLTIDANGNWEIDGIATGRPARGPAGNDGTQITISGNNTWIVDGVDTLISLTGPKGSDGAIGSILSIGPAPDYNWFINGSDTGVSASVSGSGGSGGEGGTGGEGGGEGTDPACDHQNTSWRLALPMPNIVSLLEEQYCTDCDETLKGKNRTYGNLTHWLEEQAQGTKGTISNPINLEVAIALGDIRNDTEGWGDLLAAIQAAGKYVSLDLTECTYYGYYAGALYSNTFNGNNSTVGKTYVVHITFPLGATLYGYNGSATIPVFTGFTNLKSVKGYANVMSRAFTGCTSLTEVSFPNATYIGGFKDCTNLASVSAPKAIQLEDEAFKDCTSLTEVSFPNVTGTYNSGGIEQYAFDGCINLERVSFPNAVRIASYAFRNCKKLERVYFPNAVYFYTEANSGVDPYATAVFNAFEGCTGLTEAYFPKVQAVRRNAFKDCTSLTAVYFASATDIYHDAFAGCTALERLYIPLVRNIVAGNALANSNALTDITINRNCTIDATGLSTRAASFKTYYDNAAGANKAAGTYIYAAGAWKGAE
jgi:hypothetical protein